jgi:hypothetical protein
MGTLRYERERADAMERKRRDAQTIRHRLELENEMAELKTRLQSLERELAFKQAQIDQAHERTETDDSDRDSLLEGRLKKRGADSNRRTKSGDD